MSAKRLTMRKTREILRLKFDCDLTNRQIARSCSTARSTVGEYLQRFSDARLTWPMPADMDDARLEQLLFPASDASALTDRGLPDWHYIHRELRRKAVTLMLLWQEYKEEHPNGYQYSQFCHLYRQWTGRIDPVMRQEHRAGEKMFVDYAGMTVEFFDLFSNKRREAQIFIAVMAASNYTYAEATFSQGLSDWIGAHTRAMAFFGGVAEIIVPDNTKTGVKKPSFYEPDLNPTYLDMANHYDSAIIPARVGKPKDKAKVETAVLIVERWILARLRNHQFFSLNQLNQKIRSLLDEMNTKPFQKLSGCRKSVFDTIERPALKPLPCKPYEFAEWKIATVNIDYHIECDRHYYSVPHQLMQKKIDVRITDTTIECFFKNKRVASHIRSYRKGHHTTVKEHMPKSHQKWVAWNPDRFIRWAEKIGPKTTELIKTILSSRPHPQQGFRSCMGILRLAKDYGDKRLEAACKRAVLIGGTSFRSVDSILKHGLDQKPLTGSRPPDPIIHHTNIRGAKYFH